MSMFKSSSKEQLVQLLLSLLVFLTLLLGEGISKLSLQYLVRQLFQANVSSCCRTTIPDIKTAET